MRRIGGVTMVKDIAESNSLPFPCEEVTGRIFKSDVQRYTVQFVEKEQFRLTNEFMRLRGRLNTGNYLVKDEASVRSELNDMVLQGHALDRLRSDLLSDDWWNEIEAKAHGSQSY